MFIGRKRCIAVAVGAVAGMASLSAPAVAATAPTSPLAPYVNCPAAQAIALSANGGIEPSCMVSQVTGGAITIGKGTVPITATSTLTQGSYQDANGNTVNLKGNPWFTTSAMNVPGGLLGLKGTDNLIPGLTNIKATLELATTKAMSVNLLAAIMPSVFPGPVITMPVKIHLVNPLLGNNCYIGSDSNPIVLNLNSQDPTYTADTAMNSPSAPGDESEVITHMDLVDNSFSVPAATGCGVGGLLDGVVNSRQGLPAAAGKNKVDFVTTAYAANDAAADILAYQNSLGLVG